MAVIRRVCQFCGRGFYVPDALQGDEVRLNFCCTQCAQRYHARLRAQLHRADRQVEDRRRAQRKKAFERTMNGAANPGINRFGKKFLKRI